MNIQVGNSPSSPWNPIPLLTHAFSLLAAGMLVGACSLGEVSSPEGALATLQPPTNGRAGFGVAYFADGHAGDWATTGWTTPEVQASFKRDLVILAALGVHRVKLAIEPAFLGLDFLPQAAVVNPGERAAALTAIPQIVRRLAEAGMTTELTFLTNSLMLRSGTSFNDPSLPNDYEISYSHLGVPAGAQQMARDLYELESAVINSVSSAGLAPALDYVNVATEVSYSFQRGNATPWSQLSSHLVQPLASLPAVPAGKRAADVLVPAEATTLARDVAAAGSHLDVSEVHSYYPDSRSDLVAAVQAVRAALPQTRVVIGEFGVELCDNGGDETVQAQAFAAALDQADRAGVELLLNWGLWDYNDRGCPGSSGHWGLGYNVDRPRNSMGRLVERQSALPGGNFETGLAGFNAGGTGPVQLIQGGPSRADAATNQRYLRVQAAAPGTYYACSPPFELAGSRVAVSAYLRSTSTQLSVGMHYRDAQGRWSYEPGGTAVTVQVPNPGGWGWRNVQSLTGGTLHQVPAGSTQAVACFLMQAAGAPAYLDVDAVSVNSY
jgi:hypothetical protein